MIIFAHLIFVGVWLGCVLTEALFERALLHQGRDKEKILSKLHVKVDLFIEIPSFLIVGATGAYLAIETNFDAFLIAKIIFGSLAILLNIYCVYLVFERDKAASSEDWSRFEKLDHIQHKVGAGVLALIILAIISGIAGFL